MRKKLVFVLFNCVVIVSTIVICAFGQEKVTEIKDKKITIKMDKQPLGKVFRQLINNYDVAIGFEESTLDRGHNDFDFDTNLPAPEIKAVSTDGKVEISITTQTFFEAKEHWFSINVEDARLEDVLNIIVEQMGNYKWEINDEVVNIFPIRGRDKRFEELLGINVKNFTFEKEWIVGVIKNEVIALPEFKKFLDENNLYSGIRRSGTTDHLYRKLPVEMNFSNLTFKELLNKITKVKRGGWILKKNDLFQNTKEKEYIDIDI